MKFTSEEVHKTLSQMRGYVTSIAVSRADGTIANFTVDSISEHIRDLEAKLIKLAHAIAEKL